MKDLRKKLRDTINSSILATHIGEARDVGRRFVCPSCGTIQPVDDDLRFGLHLRHIIVQRQNVPGSITNSGICDSSYTHVGSLREDAWFDAVEEQGALFREIRDLLRDIAGKP